MYCDDWDCDNDPLGDINDILAVGGENGVSLLLVLLVLLVLVFVKAVGR